MTGLLGGVLGLMDPLGGHVLAALIGPKAWAESNSGKMARLIFGGCAAGILLGSVIGAVVGVFLSLSMPEASLGLTLVSMGTAAFGGAFIGLTTFPFVVLLLEFLRRTVDGDW